MALLHGVDLSRWQVGLTIDDLVAADVSFVNIALTKGTSAHASTPEQRKAWARDAWSAGLVVGGYHWLNGEPAAAQWQVCVREALATFGTLDSWFLQVDCEDSASPATYAIAKEFCRLATRELDRPVAFYTGDWWINAQGWAPIAECAPYLWSAPESGRLAALPAAKAPVWDWKSAGGWSEIHLLQWSASQKIKGVTVSSTVVRKPGVLTALCGG
jgi:hypothetical protein